MRITVFGATGATGRELLAAALASGHTVRAFARRPEALAGLPGIEVVSGELREPAQVGRAISGADAVLSALGTGRDLSPTTVMSEGTASIIAAMRAEGVSRLLAITSGMVTPTGTEPLFFRFIGRHLLRHVHADHLRLEEHVKASGLDWTLVRPPRLLDGPARGGYRLARDAGVPGGSEITRADLARFMVAEAAERTWLRCGVAIGY
ncbi:MAG TPA: SDR family oxidoreductase [Archangium sp.]|uniref:NAD(P)-dependent oxidoreductase n=1 Tax=Archangium sp. TaxID=1872627 RepID=UPI002E316AE1|nr:SDR family oxidoreductase [Archangium sp.]HEX5748824.1 SDR family oxidoreductase [Archangium sp.]